MTSTYPLCTGWQFRTFDASFLGGKLVRIRIIVDEGGIDPGVATSLAIDNLKFEETVLVSSASAQPNPAQVNSAVNVNGSFTDTEIIPHTATINWGDGNTTAGVVVEPGAGPGTVSGTHNYVNPGVYSGVITVSDGSGAPGQAKFTATIIAAALIDIRPGVRTNEIFLRFNLPIPVLLLGGPGFNVRNVAVGSLRFGPAGARPIFGSGSSSTSTATVFRICWQRLPHPADRHPARRHAGLPQRHSGRPCVPRLRRDQDRRHAVGPCASSPWPRG